MFSPTLTINRVAFVAPTVYAAAVTFRAAHQLAPLAAEICERLDEMEEVKDCSAADFVRRLAVVAEHSPRAFKIVVQLLSGNDQPLRSFADQAEHRGGCTKQKIHLEWEAACARIRRVFPELSEQLVAMRTSALAHEDPMSREDALRAADEGE